MKLKSFHFNMKVLVLINTRKNKKLLLAKKKNPTFWLDLRLANGRIFMVQRKVPYSGLQQKRVI